MLSKKIDWNHLQTLATEAAKRAYAPYSSYKVGCAALTNSFQFIQGCNVENASYGLSFCAECSLICNLHTSGGGKLIAFICVDGANNIIMPCGRCRQLLFEHSEKGMLIKSKSAILTIDTILPNAWSKNNLKEVDNEYRKI